MKKHILFSVAGMTPQIITETLFGLLQQNPPVTAGEIHILTTSRGRDGNPPYAPGINTLATAGNDSQINKFNRTYNTQWEIREDWIEIIQDANGKQLADLRTSLDNETAANQIIERVHSWTKNPDIILHASVAGGRKTMGLFLTQAMSWYARPQDDLSHVLVDDSFEQARLYFPDPNNPQHQNVVDFASLPFVRMSGLMPKLLDNANSYTDKMQLSQLFIDDMAKRSKLTLDLTNNTLSLNDYKLLDLSPMSTALYLFLLEHANLQRGQNEFYFQNAFDYRHNLSNCLKRVSSIKNQKTGLVLLTFPEQEWKEHWKKQGELDEYDKRFYDLNSPFSRLIKDMQGLWINSNASFQVFAKSSRGIGTGIRWVDIDPQRITIIE